MEVVIFSGLLSLALSVIVGALAALFLRGSKRHSAGALQDGDAP
jgi:hypothetical protein